MTNLTRGTMTGARLVVEFGSRSAPFPDSNAPGAGDGPAAAPVPASTSTRRTTPEGSLRKRLLTISLFLGGLLIAGTPLAADDPEAHLLDAARLAGVEASPLVFDRDSEAGAEADSDRGISGKTILLATAIASAALVTAAWLLRSRCEPMDGAVWVRFPNWPAERYGTSRDGTRYRIPPPPPPPYPLPALCGPTR